MNGELYYSTNIEITTTPAARIHKVCVDESGKDTKKKRNRL